MIYKGSQYKFWPLALVIAGITSCHLCDMKNAHQSTDIAETTLSYDSLPNIMPNRLIIPGDHLTEETGFPDEIMKGITTLSIGYLGFDNKVHDGFIDVASGLSEEVVLIFNELLAVSFPIDKIRTMNYYGWSDSLSMADNNSSGFNYRVIGGSNTLSLHAYGRAIDINPMLNPYFFHGKTEPSGAVYNPDLEGTITGSSVIVSIFKKYGWKWGGDWKYVKDYQHFYKEL